MNFFAWKVATGTLATMMNKKRRHLEMLATCRVCGAEDEDSFHALITCPLAANIWECMGEIWPIPAREEVCNTGHKWLLDLLATQPENTRAIAIMLLWRISQLRNDVLHDKTNPSPEVTKQYLGTYLINRNKKEIMIS
jgi:hypothetical protein